MSYSKIFGMLPSNEKEDVKYLLLLFPCCFSVQYLFNGDFKTFSIFLQCIFAAATTIITYGIFFFGTLWVTVDSNKRKYAENKAFKSCIFTIFLLIVLGRIFGYCAWVFYPFCIIVVVSFYVLGNILHKKVAANGVTNSETNKTTDE